MAKIADDVLKKWKDGDVVTGADYTQEREMLRTAVNDNDFNIKDLKAFIDQMFDGFDTGENLADLQGFAQRIYLAQTVLGNMINDKADKSEIYTRSQLDSFNRDHKGTWGGKRTTDFLSSSTDLDRYRHVVDEGSNANGSFVKYSDGAMECWKVEKHRPTSVGAWTKAMIGSLEYWYIPGNWTYPAPFLNNSNVVVLMSGDIGLTGPETHNAWHIDHLKCGVESGILGVNGQGAEMTRQLYARGVWK